MTNPSEKNIFNIKGRELKLPFNVTIKTEDKSFQVTGTKLFKIAPNKRIVCSGKWGEERIVMKFFLESIKANHYFNKELKGLKALKRSGIRTPDIVFSGIVENTNIKVVATKEILPASDMMSEWNKSKDESVYADLQKQIVQKIAVLHNAGVKQDDLHLGNFLISDNRVYTIDGDGVDASKKGKPLSEESSLKNLSTLFGQFYPRLDKIAKQSLVHYAKCRDWDYDSTFIDRLFTRLKPRIQTIRARKFKKYLKKIFRGCSEFVHKKTEKLEYVCDRKAYNSGLEQFINDPDPYIKKGKTLLEQNASSIVQIDIDNTLYVVKTCNTKSYSLLFKKFLKNTSAKTMWRNAHLLILHGKQLPYPLLFMEEYNGPFDLKYYFIVKYVEDFTTKSYSSFFKNIEQKLNLELREL